METNEVFVKFSSKCAIEPAEFELDQEVEFIVKGTVVKKEHLTTNEGSMDIVYIIKPTEVMVK